MLMLMAALLGTVQWTLSLWQQLQTAPAWIQGLVLIVATLLLGTGLWLAWRIIRPVRTGKAARIPMTEAEIEAHLESAAAAGIDIESARRELEELARRRELETVHLALFGEISSGKSSLINALLPGAHVATDVTGGTTTSIRHHSWQRESGDEVV
ncbi:MAG: hypothetical protein HKP21_11015, partial [Xanthomonadales bacterium]|nr:50S ribosome-binding GTPase [Gammaproteobacteria bacterium]NNK05079.1 hypothetical protein [Xanthomonadales bacterium]